VTLRRRLLVAVLVTVLVALAIVGALTYTLVARSQLSQVDDDLERAHGPIEAAADGDADTRLRDVRDAAPGFYAELRDDAGSSVLVVPLRDRDGELLTLEGIDVAVPAPSGDEGRFETIGVEDDESMRVRVSHQEDGTTLIIGRSLEELVRTRRQLLWVLVATGLGAVVVATTIGAWLVRLGLRPLRDVERAAAGIGDSDLHQRVPADDPSTEVGQLAHSINHMLDRLEDAFTQRERDMAAVQESEARMRRFVADASHELRTPIAATAAYAELFERGARDRPDDLARAMSGIRNETSRMADLVEDLLLLARLDEDRPISHDAVDLCEIVGDAADAARAVDPMRSVAVRFEDVAIVSGDRNQLRQVVDNLLGNVRAHTPTGTACEVTVSIDGDDAVLSVRDEGPGMSPDDAARAFDRFHRADSSRTRASGGSGLGLSIVAAIVAAHGGRAELDAAPGTGTTVRILLPAIDDTPPAHADAPISDDTPPAERGTT
jgi:two-component system, OmpR family, sensor kinase